MTNIIKEAYNFFQTGDINKANDICLKVIEEQPNNFNALQLLGVIAFQKENYLKSAHIFKKAIKVNSNHAETHNNYSLALCRLNKFEEAIISWDKAIKINPNYAEAFYNQGNAYSELKKFNSALKSYNKAIEIKPNYKQAYNNRGNVLKDLNLLNQALESYNKALEIKPTNAEEYNNCGNIYLELRLLNEAVKYYNEAIKINPNYAEAHYNYGKALYKLKRPSEAIESYKKSIKINPNYAEAYNNLGNAYSQLKLLNEAVKCYEQAIKIDPDIDFLFGTLIQTKCALCDWDNFDNEKKQLENQIINDNKSTTPFPTLSIFDSPKIQKLAAKKWVEKEFPSTNILDPINKRSQNKKIRIGYYSADFRNHAMSYLLVNLFELHDKSKFELVAFSFGPETNDEMRSRISSAFDKFINVNLKSDKEIAQLSRDLKIDIAIDLMGFTEHNRFGIFMERCSPIQVNYLGYPGTIGSDCIDYLIADKVLILEKYKEFYSEKIIYLPDTYQVNASSHEISKKTFNRKKFGLPENSFVYCCFNQNYKISPSIFNVWMRILDSVNNSVIWLISENEISKKNIIKELKKKEINIKRIIFADRMPHPEHLARHKLADLFIDTFPYTAHTTASDALRSGLPIITIKGQSFASRVASSLLTSIGLTELITTNEKEYEELAIKLANDKSLLNSIRNKLNKNILTSPLFNTKVFTKNLEKAYLKIYEKFINNEKPENIEIN